MAILSSEGVSSARVFNLSDLSSSDKLNDEEALVPRYYRYLGGVNDLDKTRFHYKCYKKSLSVLTLFAASYAIVGRFFSLPSKKWMQIAAGIVISKELLSLSIKRWVYFGSLISRFSVITEQLQQERLRLLKRYNGLEVSLYNADNKRIDAAYFKADKAKVKGPTVLFCNSNSGFYELNEEWIREYLKRGINVFTFNYPGYAESESYPSHRNCFLATKIALMYLKRGIGLKHKEILVHGHSLGGPHAAYAASKFKGIHLCVDRSFCQLNHLIGATYGGELVRYLFSFLTDHFNLDTRAYYERTKGKKWVIQVLGNKDKTIPSHQGMAKHAKEVVWHHLNFTNAHRDHLNQQEYEQHFELVEEAFA